MRFERAADGGTAVVEFVVLAVLVMVPLAYAAVVVLKVHSATFTADTTSAASARARSAARIALADYGLPDPELSIACIDGSCLAPSSGIEVEVRTQVAIPFSPFGDGRSVIPVSAVHQARVDTYRRG